MIPFFINLLCLSNAIVIDSFWFIKFIHFWTSYCVAFKRCDYQYLLSYYKCYIQVLHNYMIHLDSLFQIWIFNNISRMRLPILQTIFIHIKPRIKYMKSTLGTSFARKHAFEVDKTLLASMPFWFHLDDLQVCLCAFKSILI